MKLQIARNQYKGNGIYLVTGKDETQSRCNLTLTQPF
jgi:hypothetical protein